MKTYLWLIAMLCLSGTLHAQKISIKSFSVKYELPADVSTWGPDAANAVAQRSGRDGTEAKMVITVKKTGSKICGNTVQSASAERITTKAITARDIKNTLENCILAPGQYTLCIQFFNLDNMDASGEQCREFSVAAPPPQGGVSSGDPSGVSNAPQTPGTSNPQTPVTPSTTKTYRKPDLISPANNTGYNPDELKKPLTLKWTPVVPQPPATDIIYTVRIYEVQPGQQPAQALKSSQPVFEKEVKTTQVIWQAPPEYTTAKENKTFVWNVQATDKEGKGYGENNGTSENWVFKMQMNPASCSLKIIQVKCKVNGKYQFTIQAYNNDNFIRKIKQLRIVAINGSSVVPINPDAFVPNATTVGANTFATVNGAFTYSGDINCVRIHVNLANPNDLYNDCNATADTCINCCTYCDNKKPKASNPVTTQIDNASGYDEIEIKTKLSYVTNTGALVPVYRVMAEIVGFEHIVNNPLCRTCNNSNKMHGVFVESNMNVITNPAGWDNSGKAVLYPATESYSRQAEWTNANGINMPTSGTEFKFRIGVPEQNALKCCCDRIRFAIRYSFVTKDEDGSCRICELVKVYCIIRGTSCGDNFMCPAIIFEGGGNGAIIH